VFLWPARGILLTTRVLRRISTADRALSE